MVNSGPMVFGSLSHKGGKWNQRSICMAKENRELLLCESREIETQSHDPRFKQLFAKRNYQISVTMIIMGPVNLSMEAQRRRSMGWDPNPAFIHVEVTRSVGFAELLICSKRVAAADARANRCVVFFLWRDIWIWLLSSTICICLIITIVCPFDNLL